jgi:two-component system cell cycle response regulator DivK
MEQLKGKRIFIVEDNVLNLAVVATLLRRYDALLTQEAWNIDTVGILLKSLPVDLILLDLMLRSGVSGYDIFDAIHADPRLKDIPVIAVSSLDPETEIPKAQAKGFSGFISKPISSVKFPEQLLACINGEKVWIASR